MSQPSQFIDVSKFPVNEQPHIIDLAHKYNAVRSDVDGIIGTSEEEKNMMHALFAAVRGAGAKLHGKRVNIFLASAQVWLITYVLKGIGVDMSLLGQVVNKALHYLADMP